MGATRPVKVESTQRGRRNATLNQSHSSQSSINRSRSRGSQQGTQSQSSVQGGRKTRPRHRLQAISENSDSDDEENATLRNRRTRPGPASSKSRSRRPVVNSDSEESDSDCNLPKPKEKIDPKGRPGKTRRPELAEEEEDKLVEEFVKKSVSYFWFTLSGNAPVKRADFTRAIFPEDKHLYNRVVTDVQKHLKDIFGMNLLAYNDQNHQTSDDIVGQRFSCLIMTSTLKVINVMQRNVYFDSKLGLDIRVYEKEGITRALLFMYLGLIFMKGLDPGVDEHSMWQIMESMEFNEILAVQQADFRKFLKTEYISTLYLTSKESRDDQGTLINMHYFWGPRSHLEFSKWDIFTRVVKMLPGNKKTLDFPAQMQMIFNSSEKDRALEEVNNELEDPNPTHPPSQDQDESDSDSDSSDHASDARTTESDTE